MKLELKKFYSLELDCSLENFFPENPENFAISAQLIVGFEKSDGGESFDILICTPDWIKEQYEEEKITWGLHMLIVLEYDYSRIRLKINRYLQSCGDGQWDTIVNKLRQIGSWEFEDYRE